MGCGGNLLQRSIQHLLVIPGLRCAEGLAGKVPGLTEVHVQTQGLASSNADVMLDTTLVDETALKGYAVHPEHVKVADSKVRPYTKTRVCMDFEV